MNRAGKNFGALALAVLVAAISGCATKSKAKLDEQNAFLAGQNAELRQQQAQQFPTVTILGPVQNHTVPWVAGLTLVQAVATANYLDSNSPKEIIITRHGESATLAGNIFQNGATVPLEAGDVVEIRP